MGTDDEQAAILALTAAYGTKFASYVQVSSGCWMWTGRSQLTHGIRYGFFGPRTAHRMVYTALVAEPPRGHVVDHRYHCVGLCVRPDHLRTATNSQNLANRAGANANSRLGVRGVALLRHGRYQGCFMCQGKKYYTSTFTTLEEAEAAIIQLRADVVGAAWAGGSRRGPARG